MANSEQENTNQEKQEIPAEELTPEDNTEETDTDQEQPQEDSNLELAENNNETDATDVEPTESNDETDSDAEQTESTPNITETARTTKPVLDGTDLDSPTPTVVVDRSSVIEAAKGEDVQHIEKQDLEDVSEEAVEKKQIKISCHGCGQKLDVTHLEAFSYIECPECSAKIIVPKWFDTYLLEEPGGLGGMATVYRGLDISLDREVAIKVLNPKLAVRKERSDLFLNEARTAATINHFGVIPVYTCGEFEGQPYIVMQYMEGGSLEDKLKLERTQIPVVDICGWIRDVAEGLDNARRHGIIHHDIKPGNIMLDGDGNAKIGDFGIAQAIHDTRTDQVYEMTKTWLSPHYVSPEKVATGREDYLGDIYSLGATFYHLLTGKTPFEHDDVQQLIRTRLVSDPTPPSKIRIDIPEKISNLVMSMLSREMDNRPNYRDIIKAINHCVKELQKNATKKTQKKVPIKNKKMVKAGDAYARSRLDASLAQHGKKKNPFISWAYYLIICSIIAACSVYLYKSGKFNSVLGKKAINGKNSFPKDLAPEIAWAFTKGDSTQAEAVAQTAFDDATADITKRAQSGLQLALAKYLNKSTNAEDNCFSIAERLQASGLDQQDAYLAIIFFLANREITPDSLEERVEIENNLDVLAKLAVLLRGVHNKDSYLKIDDYLYKYQKASDKAPKSFWGNAWGERIEGWKKSIKKKAGDKSQLEPLFAAMIVHNAKDTTPKQYTSFENRRQSVQSRKPSNKTVATAPTSPTSTINFLNVSETEFINSRKQFSARPYRNKSTIDYDKNVVKNYINSLPDNLLKAQEINRYNYINNTKDYLISLFARSEYLGPVKTKRYNFAKGQVSLANEHGLFVRRQRANKSHKCSWAEVPFEQYINFFNYFAQERTKIIGPDMTDDERKQLAADEYLHLALLCDWHGRYKDAYKYAKKSINMYPKNKSKVSKLFMGK